MFAVVRTSCVVGLEAVPVDVEVGIKNGDRRFSILGLGGAAVRESRERILSALEQCGINPPDAILVNLAPADIKKDSVVFDLPIALAIAAAVGAIPKTSLVNRAMCGELSLLGGVKATSGMIAHALAAVHEGIDAILVPKANAPEAALIEGINVVGIESLAEALELLKQRELPVTPSSPGHPSRPQKPSQALHDVRGQHLAKRALAIAAAGGHNMLMIGPPGCGKSMLAERLSTLLPPLNADELIEVLKIHSVAHQSTESIVTGCRPYRTPHYMVSDAGLIGGGAGPKPGEVSLAHRGVLFLDEFPEFKRSGIEALRSPMETGTVQIARARATVEFPARFQMIAAMNPCPCGRFGSGVGTCRCSHHAVRDYLAKLSQPILDRIDLHVELEAVRIEELVWEGSVPRGDESEDMIPKVFEARRLQYERQAVLNCELSDSNLKSILCIQDTARRLLAEMVQRLGISARGFTRILRVARTIADIEGSAEITEEIIGEAISYRSLERLSSIVYGTVPSRISQ